MAPSWQNPNYERERLRRRSLAVIASVLLVATAAAAWQLSRRDAQPGPPAPSDAAMPARPAAGSTAASHGSPAAPDANSGAATQPEQPITDEFDLDADGAPWPASEGLAPDDFAGRKALALSLYRQNDLPGAQRAAKSALALQRDDDLIDLLVKLDQEIRVQRDYDDARTVHFTVLFDGYEHDEVKATVLGCLKDAYGEIGKELGHFPAEPVTVILYTGKDFSDVTRAPEWVGGMFGRLDGKIRVPVQGIAGQEAALRRVLFHEYAHALLYSMAPGCPMWLHEGLAQHLSGERGVSVGQVIPLGLLVGGFPRDARAAAAAYMESLQAVSDLIDERGMPPLRRLLKELGAGKSLEEAFAAAYGKPFSRWASRWRPVESRDAAGEPDASENEG